MVDDTGLLRTEQGSAPICVSVLNIATIFDTLTMTLGGYHALLDFPCLLSDKINLPSCVRGKNMPLSSSPRLSV